MELLSDKVLIDCYLKAMELEVGVDIDRDFVLLLLAEIQKRKLDVRGYPTKERVPWEVWENNPLLFFEKQGRAVRHPGD